MIDMRNSLITRLVIVIALTALLSFLAVYRVVYRSASDSFIQQQNEELHFRGTSQLEQSLGPEMESAYINGGWQEAQTLLGQGRYRALLKGFNLIVIDESDSIVVTTHDDLLSANVSRIAPHQFELGGRRNNGAEYEIVVNGGIQLHDRAGQPFADLIALPIGVEQEVGDAFASNVWNAAGLWLVGILALSVFATVAFLRRSLKPLKELTAAAEQLQAGTIPPTIAEQGSTEFQSLISAFNSATETISRTDSIRRQLISDVAHELRTPLTNISSLMEAFEKGLIADAEAVHSLRCETRLLERLVSDFQQLAQSDTGQLQINLFAIPLAEVVASSLESIAEAEAIQLKILVPESLHVVADEDRLRQVLSNLLDNSMRHRSDGLKVEITATTDGDQARILFGDNGPGIDEKDRPFVFDRFYRAEKSRNRSTGGSGLGLSIIKSLIEAMHGTIKLIDNPTSNGAIFEISLPIAQPTNGPDRVI